MRVKPARRPLRPLKSCLKKTRQNFESIAVVADVAPPPSVQQVGQNQPCPPDRPQEKLEDFDRPLTRKAQELFEELFGDDPDVLDDLDEDLGPWTAEDFE
jgi:hypothetical protein